MLQPKRQKFRKMQKGRMTGISGRGHLLSNGMFGLKSLETSFITARQIEAARIAATRYMKREGQVWIRVVPDRPITRKPQEVRMGKGKGSLDHYVSMIQPGRIMFEIDGVSEEIAYEALRLAAQKLPMLTKITVRPDIVKF